MPRHAAVFLDRDNTIIVNDGDLGDPDKVQLIQGAAAAIGSLRGLGYKIIVVTNQGGVARGHYTEKDVDAVHARINEIIRKTASGSFVDRFYYCPFHPQGTVAKYKKEHPWRKPQPGMLKQAAEDMGLDLEQCWMIGDQSRDIAAGNAVGARTILIDSRQMHRVMKENPVAEGEGPNFIARTLVEAVRFVAQSRRPEMAEDIRADEPGSTQWNEAAAAAIRQREETLKAASAGKALISPYRNKPAEIKRPFRPMALPIEEDEPDDETMESEHDVKVKESAPPSPRTPEPELKADPEPEIEPVREPEPKPEPPAVPKTEKRVVEPVPLGPPPEVIERRKPPKPVEIKREHRPEPAPPIVEPKPASPIEPSRPAIPEPVIREQSIEQPDESLPSKSQGRPMTSDTLLRQILHELRSQNQRSAMKDWSTLGYVAIVLQLVAGLCLLAGLLMGQGNDLVFIKWLGTGILMQLAVIAILLFDR